MRKALLMVGLLFALGILSATHYQRLGYDKESPLDQFYQSIRWPEGITTLAIILTLGAIVWQSDETRRSAKASERSVIAALTQIQMMKAHERARLEVNAKGLQIWRNSKTKEWSVEARIALRNIGRGRAYLSNSSERFLMLPSESAPPHH